MQLESSSPVMLSKITSMGSNLSDFTLPIEELELSESGGSTSSLETEKNLSQMSQMTINKVKNDS